MNHVLHVPLPTHGLSGCSHLTMIVNKAVHILFFVSDFFCLKYVCEINLCCCGCLQLAHCPCCIALHGVNRPQFLYPATFDGLSIYCWQFPYPSLRPVSGLQAVRSCACLCGECVCIHLLRVCTVVDLLGLGCVCVCFLWFPTWY